MKVLVCLDGEPHTRGAIDRAIGLARSGSADIIGVHVIDEWLRQFSSEIYAQGRREYLEWVDQCLHEKASIVREAFAAQCHANNVTARFMLRDGDPLAEILDIARELEPELVLVGGRPLKGLARFRSGKLPERLARRLRGTMQVVCARSPAHDSLRDSDSHPNEVTSI